MCHLNNAKEVKHYYVVPSAQESVIVIYSSIFTSNKVCLPTVPNHLVLRVCISSTTLSSTVVFTTTGTLACQWLFKLMKCRLVDNAGTEELRPRTVCVRHQSHSEDLY